MFKRTKAILSFVMCMVLLFAVCVPNFSGITAAATEYQYITYDFDDLEVGSSVASPWATLNNANATIAQDPDDSTNKCIYVNDKVATDSLAETTYLTFDKVYDEFVLEAKIRYDKPTNTSGASFAISTSTTRASGAPEICLHWLSNGDLAVYYGGGSSNRYVITSNAWGKWFKFKFTIDPVSRSFDLSVNDGEYEYKDLGYRFDRDNTEFFSVLSIAPFAAYRGNYYIDDVVVPNGEAPKTVDRYTPEYNKVEILYDGDTETPETDEYYTHAYSAFPTLLHLSDEEVMVVFKRGIGHAYNEGHDDIMIYNPKTEEIVSHESFYNVEGENPQNPELAKMPNGDIVAFLDRQTATANLTSIGVKKYRLKYDAETGTYADEWVFDPGNTEDEPTNNDEFALLQDTDGVQYFSTFDDAVVGDTIYELAITGGSHANTLAGYDKYNNGDTAVHVIKSTDNGYTWEHVMNVTEACGMSINESSLEPLDDGGFFFVCRGYDLKTTVFTTDADFNITNKSVVSNEYSCIQYIGRPKIFKKDGEYYLVCRNVRSGANEELALYRFDVENLAPETYVVIEEPMTTASSLGGHGHYTEPFFVEKDGVEYLNLINYTNAYTCNPDIVRYELKWDEIKDPVIKTPDETETVTVAVPVAESESWNNAVVPIYDTELSNLSVSFEYTAINDAKWYFDVVDDDYSNCYSLNLTAGGMTLNRTVAGETTALATYSGFENGKYYEIQLVRYMQDITVFVDGAKAMTVAEEDAAYPVTTTGTNTHWHGKLYLDDEKTSVTNIKVYDSGLITFENGYAVLGNIALSDSISSLHAISTVSGTATVGTGTVTSTANTVDAKYSTGSNPVVYTTGWLNEDVGDFVLTYTDRHGRWDWTAKALLLSATPKESLSGGQWIQYSSTTNEVANIFNNGDAIITGVNQYETNNRYFNITDGKIINDTGALGVGTIYSNVKIKAVKKADKLTVTIGNDVIGYKTVYDGVSSNIVGNIFAAQYQGSIKAQNIKVTDTVNTKEIVTADNTYIAGDLTDNGTLNSDDLVLMRKNLIKSYIPKSQKLADANTDKKVDIRDLVRLKKEIVGK